MPRYKLTLEYDGTPFVGWQKQAEGSSVQGQLEEALYHLTGERFTPRGAGRTDAGVHARGQVAHIDLKTSWESNKIRDGLNYHLKPDPIAIIDVLPVDETFDARFSALARHYQYHLINRRARLALDRNLAAHEGRALDKTAMHEAAQFFRGHHDFTTFRSAHCQSKSPLKSIDRFTVERLGERIIFKVSARSFMHNQVRSMVGSLIEVGLGKWPVSGIRDALEACDRAACGPVAPACGLYFWSVDYDSA